MDCQQSSLAWHKWGKRGAERPIDNPGPRGQRSESGFPARAAIALGSTATISLAYIDATAVNVATFTLATKDASPTERRSGIEES